MVYAMALSRSFAFAVILVLCYIPLGLAGPDISVQLNVFSNNSQSDPRAAVLENGNFVVVYESENQVAADSGDDVFAIIADENLETIVTEFVINDNTTGNQDTPDVEALSNGNFVAVWESFGQVDENDVFLQIFTANGDRVLGADILVNVNTVGDQGDPAVARLDNDKFVVIWQDGVDINGQIFNNDGGRFGGILILVQNRNNGVVSGIDNSDGTFAVVYEEGTTVQGSIFGEFGQAVSSFTVSNENESDEPSISSLGDGFVVTFTKTINGDSDVFAQRFDEVGVPVGDQILVNTFSTGIQRDSNVFATVDGFSVVWESLENEQQVFLQSFDENGDKIDDEKLVNVNLPGNDVAGAGLQNGNIVAVWEKETGDAILQDDIEAGLFVKDEENEDEDNNNTGAVIGASVGGVLGVLLLGVAFRRWRKGDSSTILKEEYSSDYESPFSGTNNITHYPPPQQRGFQPSMMPPPPRYGGQRGNFPNGGGVPAPANNGFRGPTMAAPPRAMAAPNNNGFRGPTMAAPPMGQAPMLRPDAFGPANGGQQLKGQNSFFYRPNVSMGNRTLPSAKWFSKVYKRGNDSSR